MVEYGKKYVSLWDKALNVADVQIDHLEERLVKDKKTQSREDDGTQREIIRSFFSSYEEYST